MGRFRYMRNGGQGHCCFDTVAQALAIREGWEVDVVERAFTTGDSVQLFSIHQALRRLTVEVFDSSENDMIIGDMPGNRTAHSKDAMRRLALDYNKRIINADDFRNVVLYMDPELYPWGQRLKYWISTSMGPRHGAWRSTTATGTGLSSYAT